MLIELQYGVYDIYRQGHVVDIVVDDLYDVDQCSCLLIKMREIKNLLQISKMMLLHHQQQSLPLLLQLSPIENIHYVVVVVVVVIIVFT